jgi:hypothetical protein
MTDLLSILSDQPADEDRLHFAHYAMTIDADGSTPSIQWHTGDRP